VVLFVVALLAIPGVWFGLGILEEQRARPTELVPPPPTEVAPPIAVPVVPKAAPIDPKLTEMMVAKVGVGGARGAASSIPLKPVKKAGKKKRR
jgi:hypothetical protein